jgi:hypothetical protein
MSRVATFDGRALVREHDPSSRAPGGYADSRTGVPPLADKSPRALRQNRAYGQRRVRAVYPSLASENRQRNLRGLVTARPRRLPANPNAGAPIATRCRRSRRDDCAVRPAVPTARARCLSQSETLKAWNFVVPLALSQPDARPGPSTPGASLAASLLSPRSSRPAPIGEATRLAPRAVGR